MFISKILFCSSSDDRFLLVEKSKLIDIYFFIHAGTLILFWVNFIYLYHGFIRTAKNEYSHIMNLNKLEDEVIEKIMDFLDKLGVKSVDNRKNQKLFEMIEKFNWKNCLCYVLCFLACLFPALILILIFAQIQKMFIRLFSRVTLLVKCSKNLLLNVILLNIWSRSRIKIWNLTTI